MIYISPQSGAAPVVQFIERAQGQLGSEVYHLTSKPILRAIHDAVRRGVATFVIVDGRPYRMSRKRVRKEIAGIAATGVKVETAPARLKGTRCFDHAKYAVTQGAAIIGTANWDWSAFHRNRTMSFIGSQNFSGASLNKNREIGIVLQEAAARNELIGSSLMIGTMR